ncbi:MBL fold metallo-hydrolase [uncultured Cohaesibacter sp.]|uniref:MBL fold metallo-hydrolase n=1 Tax=uncultured Cohaesibacter sp. TaxID=1002546 RepID=UPI0029C689C4|nr:MBL fold metallo-hydrolase [uncultured Cohaesibacter sp.]
MSSRSETALFPRLAAIKGLIPGILSILLLTGCMFNRETDEDDGWHSLFEEPHRHYQNIGAKYQPDATKMDWFRHGLKLAFGLYPGREHLPPDMALPIKQANHQFKEALTATNRITWFGHASFLINIGNRRILTDPTFARYIGHFPILTKRLNPVAPNWRQLDRLDAVLITHADYDHLDLTSLRMLRQIYPRLQLILPAGTTMMLEDFPKTAIREMNWYDNETVGSISVTFVPAIHGVRRPPHELDSALWGGYLLQSGGRKLYLSGDIGPGTVYRDIASRFAPIDTAVVPIGGYEPQSFNRAFHVPPDGAVDIARQLGAKRVIASHWGTFPLSEDTGKEQKQAFLTASTKAAPRKHVMKVGESRPLWRD